MTLPGDIVECNCGALQVLPKNRHVPLHKREGTQFSCRWSGVDTDHWDPVSRCPKCGVTNQIRNTEDGTKFGCAACGRVGPLTDFVRGLQHQPKPELTKSPGRHRYAGKTAAPAAANPPRCPACEGVRIQKSNGKYPFVCADCGTAGPLADFVVKQEGHKPRAMTAASGGYIPVTKPVIPDRDIHGELEAQFSGQLSEDEFEDIYGLAEQAAKKAFANRKRATTLLGTRASQYNPMLDTFQEYFDNLQAKVANRASDKEVGSDLQYLAYWGVLEQECKNHDVRFRREDMAERGL